MSPLIQLNVALTLSSFFLTSFPVYTLGIPDMSSLDSSVTSEAKKTSPEYYRQRRQQLQAGIIQKRHETSAKNNIAYIKRRCKR